MLQIAKSCHQIENDQDVKRLSQTINVSHFLKASMQFNKKNYTHMNQLEKGGHSRIFRAINVSNQQECILKKINLGRSQKLQLWEPYILSQCHHKNIIQINNFMFETKYLWLETELCQQNLSSYIKKKNNDLLSCQNSIEFNQINEQYIKQNLDIIKQIIDGLLFLHTEKQIIHRDIKPSNIFIKDGQIKIGDFGLARPQNIKLEIDDLQCFTNLYASPEQISKIALDYTSDIYSLGIVILELILNMNTIMEMIKTIKKCNNNQVEDLQIMNNNFKQLIVSCLQVSQNMRPTLQQLKDSVQFYTNEI